MPIGNQNSDSDPLQLPRFSLLHIDEVEAAYPEEKEAKQLKLTESQQKFETQ